MPELLNDQLILTTVVPQKSIPRSVLRV